jgi:hypothetical protein
MRENDVTVEASPVHDFTGRCLVPFCAFQPECAIALANIPLESLANSNISDLASIEREIFECTAENGKLLPKNPRYWDIQDDGSVLVYVRN